MLKIYITTIIFITCSSMTFSQFGDFSLRRNFSSIIFLVDSIPKKEMYNGILYEVLIRNQITGKVTTYKDVISGSGFIVAKDLDIYLVTAEHVATALKIEPYIIFKGRSGKRKEFKIKDLVDSGAKWSIHNIADVAVLPLNRTKVDSLTKMELTAFDFYKIENRKTAPDREDNLVVGGFPLRLGVTEDSISPITKGVKTASDIIRLNRFDNKGASPFYLLDDPSVSGFSGGPILQIEEPILDLRDSLLINYPPKIMGLVHGTISQQAGGFAAIVPSYLIGETIDMVPSFNGDYTYKHPNGKDWSKRHYKNGIPWTVFYNNNPNGKPQEMGTLRNGNGTLYVYDQNGNLITVEHFKNGKFIKSEPANLSNDIKRIGNLKVILPKKN